MATLLVFHEVDDVDQWLASPKRDEFFGPMGITARTFRDPGKPEQGRRDLRGGFRTSRRSSRACRAMRRRRQMKNINSGSAPKRS